MSANPSSWYVSAEGQQAAGPFTAEQIIQAWQAGRLASDALCWREGMAQWLPLAESDPFASTIRLAKAATQSPTGSPGYQAVSGRRAPAHNSTSLRSRGPGARLVAASIGGGIALLVVAGVALIVLLRRGEGVHGRSAANSRRNPPRGSSITTTDLGATVQRTRELLQEVHDECTRVRAENRGNEIALLSAVTRACAEGKNKIEQEFSSFQGKTVRWRFTVSEVRPGLRDMVVAVNEQREHRDFQDSSFGYIGETDIYFSFGEPSYGQTDDLHVGKEVPASLAEKLRPGDPLVVRGTVRVKVRAEPNTFVIPHPTSISVVFLLTGITVEGVNQ